MLTSAPSKAKYSSTLSPSDAYASPFSWSEPSVSSRRAALPSTSHAQGAGAGPWRWIEKSNSRDGGYGDARDSVLGRDVARDHLGPHVLVGEQRQALAVGHEDGRDVVLRHQLGGMADGGGRLARAKRAGEQVADAHGREPGEAM